MPTLSLKAVLSGDGVGFHAMLNRADASVKRFGSNTLSGLKGQIAGAFAVGAVTAGIKSVVDGAGKIADTAKRWSISTDAVQQFQHAFDETGASVEEFERGIKALANTRLDALKNQTGETAKAFRSLGISTEELRNSRLEELFLRVADGVEKANDPQAAMVQMMQVLGGKSSTLFPAMREGLRGVTEQAKALGLVMGEGVITRLDDIGDAWERNIKRMKVAAGTMLDGVFSTIDDLNAFAEIFALANERVNQKNSGEGALGQMSDAEWQAYFSQASAEIVSKSQEIRKSREAQTPEPSSNFEDRKKDVVKLNQQASEVERSNMLDALSIQEKRLFIEKEIAEAIKRQNYAKDVLGDPVKAAEERLNVARLKSQLSAIPEEKEKPEKLTANRIETDSLLRVGNFLGSSGGAVISIAQKQLEIAKEQLKYARITADHLTKSKSSVADMNGGMLG